MPTWRFSLSSESKIINQNSVEITHNCEFNSGPAVDPMGFQDANPETGSPPPHLISHHLPVWQFLFLLPSLVPKPLSNVLLVYVRDTILIKNKHAKKMHLKSKPSFAPFLKVNIASDAFWIFVDLFLYNYVPMHPHV